LDILEEYARQQTWRHWRTYLDSIPVAPADHVLDLGCSVGGMAAILADKVQLVTGIDLEPNFVDYCDVNRQSNQRFICADFDKFDLASLGPVNGVWSSFAVSYVADTKPLLRRLHALLPPGGWAAMVDVSCFISGNLPLDSRFQKDVRAFELESGQSGLYDFDFASKMEGGLRDAGFSIIHVDNDVSDAEFNFDGAATPAVLNNWRARLQRMQRLRQHFPLQYDEISTELLAHLQSPAHAKRSNVKFVVAQKE
jgi:SAM-dependent methyltransferase